MHPDVVLRVHRAPGGRLLGHPQQPVRRLPPVPGRLGDPFRGTGHGGRVLQPALPAVRPLRAERVDGHQQPGRVQHVGDLVLPGVGVAHGVGQHRPHPLRDGEAEGAGGQAHRAGAGAGPPVADHLQPQRVPVPLPPRGDPAGRPVRPAGGQLPADLGVRPEQHGQPLAGQVVPSGLRGAAAAVRGGEQPAQRGPAGRAVPGEEDRARRRLVDERPAAHRHPAAHPAVLLFGVRHGESGAEQRPHPGPRARLGEPHRAGHRVPVGQRERVHPPLRGALRQRLGVAGAVPQGEPGGGVQMRKARHAHLLLLICPPGSRSGPRTCCFPP